MWSPMRRTSHFFLIFSDTEDQLSLYFGSGSSEMHQISNLTNRTNVFSITKRWLWIKKKKKCFYSDTWSKENLDGHSTKATKISYVVINYISASNTFYSGNCYKHSVSEKSKWKMCTNYQMACKKSTTRTYLQEKEKKMACVRDFTKRMLEQDVEFWEYGYLKHKT